MKILYTLFLIILYCPVLMAQDTTASLHDLTITIKGFSSNDGAAMVALVNSKKNWQSDSSSFRNAIPKIVDKKVVVIFNDLPKGTYAVKAYHDENENKELDTNFIGIPQEAYGFSNNARGNFGPADWQDAKFEILQDKEITLIVE